MKFNKVVVTGMGALTPIGNHVKAYWKNLSKGISGADSITKFDISNYKTQFACELKGFDPKNHLDFKEIKKLDQYAQYGLIACEEAIQDAKFLSDKINLERAGVIWGTGIGGLQSFEDEVIEFTKKGEIPKFSPFFIPKMIGDMAAGHISIKYGFKGPNYTTVSACASAANALIDAFHLIRLQEADMMVAGGSEAPITKSGIGGFNALTALSKRNDDPKTASRPFDKDRDGFVMGEGAGAIILESHEHALKRGAKIYAEFLGIGMSSDAYHMTKPDPEGKGLILVMKNALKNAGLHPEEVDYINVHGTSTYLGDIAEIKAIKEVFGAHAYQLNISSTKSMIGHLLGGAGAVEAIAAILAIQHQTISPTINHFTLDEKIDKKLNLTFNKAQKRKVNIVLSNSFGFGGHNCSVIFKKYED